MSWPLPGPFNEVCNGADTDPAYQIDPFLVSDLGVNNVGGDTGSFIIQERWKKSFICFQPSLISFERLDGLTSSGL